MMTKDELVQKIQAEIDSLEKNKVDNSKVGEIVNDFCEKYSNIKPSSFDTINLYDFSVLYFLGQRNDLAYDEIKNILMPLNDVIDKVINPLDAQQLFTDFCIIIAYNKVEFFKNIIKDDKFVDNLNSERKKINNDIRTKVISSVENADDIIDKYNLNREKIIKLFDVFRKYQYEMDAVANFICGIKFIKILKLRKRVEGYDEKNSSELDLEIIDNINTKFLYEQIDYIVNYKNELEAKNKSRVVKIEKRQKELLDFINELEVDENKEITAYQKMLGKINEDLRLDALKIIYTHNEKIYDNISQKHLDLIQNKQIKYQHLLGNYGLIQGTYSLPNILKINYDELEKGLELLKKFDIKDKILSYALENFNLELLEKIDYYFQREIINKKFIKKNFLILIANSEESNNLIKNIEVLEKENINPTIFKNSAKNLLIDYQLFLKNINILKEYSLLSSLKTTTNHNFLQDENLENKIDKLLELGMEKFLEENIGLLNNRNINRLYILRELNIPINTAQDLNDFLSLKNFYVSDEKLLEYIFQPSFADVEDNSNATVDLNKFNSTMRTLNINGIFFSKNKVMRNLKSNSYEDVKKALFKDFIFTSEEEINLVNEGLENEKVYNLKIN